MAFRRSALLKLTIAAGSILASLALAEGVVRVCFPHVRDHVVPAGVVEIDQRLGWRLRPGADAVHASRYFRVEYAINQLGFRDGARRVERRPGVRRALLYGDSQAFGWGVPAERRFSNLVEARVADLELWNLSVPGYGLDQELLSWEQGGDRFAADEVILLVTPYTLSRLRYAHIYRKDKPRFELDPAGRARLVPIGRGPNVLTRLAYDTLSGLYLPYFVEQRLPGASRAVRVGSPGGDAPNSAGGFRRASSAADAAPGIELTALELAVLERSRARADAANLALTLLVSLPPSFEPAKRGLESFAAASGVGCLEIEVPSDDDRYVFGPEDGHWNERAHTLIAEQLARSFAAR
jgi:hypothetical protein